MAHKPVGSGFTATSNGTSSQSNSFTQYTDTLRIVAIGKNGHVAVGTNPTSSHVDYFVVDALPETLSIGKPKSQKVVGITTGTTTILDFPEGTGSPFDVNDTVSLTVSNQPYFDFSHKVVTSVNNSSNTSGFYSTRIIVNHNTSGIATAYNSNNYADLKGSLKASFMSDGGSGFAYFQQIQISGDQ